MKLSQLSTDKALDVLCQITPYISNIVTDEAITKTIGKSVSTEGMTTAGVMMAGVDRITKFIPMLFKTHREDLYGIVSAVNEMEIEAIRKQNILKTMVQVRDVLQDQDLVNFFKSFMQQEQSA